MRYKLFNPYNTGALVFRHRQTVETQIRRLIYAGFDLGLHGLLIEFCILK